MDFLLSISLMFFFMLLFFVIVVKSRKYQELVTLAVFYATLIFFVVFFGHMMLSAYFVAYAHFFAFVKEVINVPPVLVFFLFYAGSLFVLVQDAKRLQ